MTELHLTIGLPASGKTTWARVAVDARRAAGISAARVNRDDLRVMLFGRLTGVPEDLVTAVAHHTVAALLAAEHPNGRVRERAQNPECDSRPCPPHLLKRSINTISRDSSKSLPVTKSVTNLQTNPQQHLYSQDPSTQLLTITPMHHDPMGTARLRRDGAHRVVQLTERPEGDTSPTAIALVRGRSSAVAAEGVGRR